MKNLAKRSSRPHVTFRVCLGLFICALALAFSARASAAQPLPETRARLDADWGHFQELSAPGSKLSLLTYRFLFDSYLQDLAAYPDAYLNFLARTSISIEDRRLALDEFTAWWAVEEAVQKAFGEKSLGSEALLKIYFDESRRSRLSAPEAKRVRFVEVILTQGFSDSMRFALELIQKSETRVDGIQRLREFATALGVLLRDQRCIPVVAALSGALYDISDDESVAPQVQERIHDIALEVMSQLDRAAKGFDGIDILAPENLLGGAVLAKLAAPFLLRSLSARFIRYSWHTSSALQKAGAVSLLASPLAIGSLRKRKVRPASEVTLFHRTSDRAGALSRDANKISFQDP